MYVDNSQALDAVSNIKNHVSRCFAKCAEKGSTFGGNNVLANLSTAITMIPQTVEGGLPFGYTPLEYIESTGTQYIDTGWTFGTSNYNKARIVFDAVVGTASNGWAVSGVGAQPSFYGGVGANRVIYYGDGNVDTSTGVTYTENRVLFEVDLQNKKVKVTDKTTGKILVDLSSITVSTPSKTSSFYLFAYRNGSDGKAYCHNEKLYSYKIYDNGTLVRDFVPAKNSSGAVGLYDLVNGVFYTNAGSGNFIGGEFAGSNFSGFSVTWNENGEDTYTVNFGSYGTDWKAISCYSDNKDGHYNIVKVSSTHCIISGAYFVDLQSQWDDNFGIYPMQRGTFRARYSISGSSITFTNDEYDGAENGFTVPDGFVGIATQASNTINDYYSNSYKLDKITVLY